MFIFPLEFKETLLKNIWQISVLIPEIYKPELSQESIFSHLLRGVGVGVGGESNGVVSRKVQIVSN